MTRSEMQRKTLENVIGRLSGNPAFGGSEEVNAMLKDDRLRLYLGTWVISALEELNAANDETRSKFKRAESAHWALKISSR